MVKKSPVHTKYIFPGDIKITVDGVKDLSLTYKEKHLFDTVGRQVVIGNDMVMNLSLGSLIFELDLGIITIYHTDSKGKVRRWLIPTDYAIADVRIEYDESES